MLISGSLPNISHYKDKVLYFHFPGIKPLHSYLEASINRTLVEKTALILKPQ